MGALTVSINNVAVQVIEGSFQETDSISAVSTVLFKVRDDNGLNHYTKGMPVSISDSITGLTFTGLVAQAIEDRVSPNTLIITDIGVRDNHVLAERRTYDGPEFTNMAAGVILCQLLNTLSQEGVTAKYAIRRDTATADFNAGTLSSVVGASNVGDGDLELSLAGTPVTILESTTSNFSSGSLTGVTAASNTLTPTATPAIKLVATCSTPGSTNAYTYVKIWGGSHVIPATEFCSYDIFVTADSPSAQCSVDMVFSDGTTWRDTFVYADVQNVGPHPTNDVGPMDVGQWYHRLFYMGNFSGKTISTVSVACEGDAVGVYTAYFKNIRLDNSAFYFFQTTLQQTPQQLQNNGYSSAVVSVVNTYALSANADLAPRRISTSYSIDAAKILQSSNLTWTAVEPPGTKMIVKISYDGASNIYQTCTKNAPLPGFVPGAKIASKSLVISEAFVYDLASTTPRNPEVAPVLSALQITINPSYNATKTDMLYEVAGNADWAAGTFTNTTNNSGTQLFLKGNRRDWDDGDFSNQTLWAVSGSQSPDRQRFSITLPSGSDARSQMVNAGSIADGTLEVDILVDNSLGRNGVVYRTTNWNNNNFTFAYGVLVTTTAITLFHGSNAGSSGSATTISTATLAITSGNWHRLKVVFVGTSHKVYLDDVLYINATDSFTTAAGGIGLRTENATGASYTAFFDNFGVLGSGSSLTGTWVSANQSLTGAGTYGNSIITWRDVSSDPGNTDTLLIETQVDGSTWQTATNGGAIANLTPGQSLSGINLKIRMTLTTTTASTMPGIDSLQVWISSQLNASGNRISPALSLSNVGRLGGSLIAWNANVNGGTLGVDVSLNGGSTWTDVTSGNGSPIPGITAQPLPMLDSFDAGSIGGTTYVPRIFGGTLILSAAPTGTTIGNYTQSNYGGGVNATWTWDIANSRVIGTGGSRAVLQYTGLSFADGYVLADMDYADGDATSSPGIFMRMTDTSHLYFLKINDASSGQAPNTIKLFVKNGAGAATQVGSDGTINFIRGTYHRIKMEITGSAFTVSFDGQVVISATDATLSAAGLAGILDGVKVQCYQLYIQPYGQDVSSVSLKTRLRLATTLPTATPQVLDLTVATFGNTIQAGATIPQTTMYHKYCDKNIDDLAKASNFWWYFDKNKVASFLSMTGLPAPWIASDGGLPVTGSPAGDFMDANITVEDASDLYRNRQIIDNVLAPTTINEDRIGDGVTTSWTFGNQWASAPTILVNGVAASVGVKNVDTGKQFYYAVGDPTITEDSSGPVYDFTFTLSFSGPGQYLTYSQADNTVEQAALLAIEGGGTGIVTNVEDGTGLTKAQGDTLAQARINQYSVRGRLLKATTRRSGLTPGMLLNVFLPAHNVFDELFLIRQITTRLTTEYGAQQGWYTVEAISGPDVGDWTKLYQRT